MFIFNVIYIKTNISKCISHQFLKRGYSLAIHSYKMFWSNKCSLGEHKRLLSKHKKNSYWPRGSVYKLERKLTKNILIYFKKSIYKISIKMYISFILKKFCFGSCFISICLDSWPLSKVPVATIISGFEPLPYWHTRCTD